MSDADLRELAALAREGRMTKREQVRVVRELRQALGDRARYYADIVALRERIKEMLEE